MDNYISYLKFPKTRTNHHHLNKSVHDKLKKNGIIIKIVENELIRTL